MTAANRLSLDEGFEVLRSRFRDPNFLACKGLGNEIPFHVFPYDASLEFEVRKRIGLLVQDFSLDEDRARAIHMDLWDVFLALCEEKRILNKLDKMERDRGREWLQTRLQSIASPGAFVSTMSRLYRERYGGQQQGRDVLLISGVGKVYPFARAHGILENAQPIFPDIPVVLMYPGSYDGHALKLFGTLADGNYYRAFCLI